ncbi:MAG TPA: DUF4434 domain-containing protein [Jatrophihabitantaceae bacterium]|jgi:hypothetical protein
MTTLPNLRPKPRRLRAALLVAAVTTGVLASPAGLTSRAAAAPSDCTVPAATPALNGSFVDPNWETWWNAADTANMAGQLCRAGITDVILQQAADPDLAQINYPTANAGLAHLRYTGTDAIGNWAQALAAHHGMHLYVGLGLESRSWFPTAGNASALPGYLAAKRTLDETLARDIVSHYGSRDDFAQVFAGWYLPDEIDSEAYLVPGTATVRSHAAVLGASFLGPLTATLHGLTPKATVFSSPFYDADRFPSTGWSALWKALLDSSVAAAGPAGALDAVAPQDGLGHGGGSAVAGQLDAWFAALASGIQHSAAAGRTRVWDNVETYRLDGRGHFATTADMLTAMRSASAHTTIDKYISFSYAEDQTQHAPLAAGYLAYVDGHADTVAPAVPGAVRVGLTRSRSAMLLRWSPSSDNAGGSGVAGYRVFRDGRLAVELDNPAQASFTDIGLTTARHSWFVVAFDGAGNQSAHSRTVAASVAAAHSGKGRNLSLHARYWFTGNVPRSPYRDGCVAATRARACAGRLTSGHAAPKDPLPSRYPDMFSGADGVPGNMTVTVDLGAVRTVGEVDSRWLSYTAMGVWLPKTVAVSVSTDGRSWRSVGTSGPPYRPINAGIWPNYVSTAWRNFAGLYSIGGLRVHARFVRLVATNPYGSGDWTMAHAIEVYSPRT